MRCSSAAKRIPALVDGELSPAASTALRDHIAVCEKCRALETQLLSLGSALESWRPVAPSGDYGALMALVEQRSARPATPIYRAPRWAVAGAAALGIVVGTTLGIQAPQTPHPPLPTQEQAVSAMGLQSFDDSVHASLVVGMDLDDSPRESQQ